MNAPSTNSSDVERRRMLPFIVEFVKFSAGFAVIIAVGLVALHVATTIS